MSFQPEGSEGPTQFGQQPYPPQQYAPPQYGPQYPPPGYPPQPYVQQPPPRKRKSNAPLIIGIIAAVVLLCCGGAVIFYAIGTSKLPASSNGTGGDAADDGNARDPGTAVGLNQPVRDGKFEFTVTAVQCGIASVGSDVLGRQAQGQYCRVNVTVKNIGNEAKTFTSGNVFAYNATGQKYDADTAAAIYLDDSRSFYEDINPGNAVNGVVLFDIPMDQSIVKLEFHDSLFSGGATVKVS